MTCHNERLNTGGLSLDLADHTPIGEMPDIWEKVVTKLNSRAMPPAGAPRPEASTYVAVAQAIERSLDAAALARPVPGRVGVHRLNRIEYTNAVRDLFGIDVDGRALLPSEQDAQEGFDNMANMLSPSAALMENYLSAARTISRLALGSAPQDPIVKTFKVPKNLAQDDEMNGLPLGSQGGAIVRHYFPVEGVYTIKAILRRQLYDYIIGMGEPHQVDIRLDGARLQRFTIGGAAKGMPMPLTYAGNTQGDPEFEIYMHEADANLEVKVPVSAGSHEVSVSFVRQFWESEGFVQPTPTGFFKATNEGYYTSPAVDRIIIGGPYGPTAPGESTARRKLLVCSPADGSTELSCAMAILRTVAKRAYRRPLTGADLAKLMKFYGAGYRDGGFQEGVRQGLEWILTSPSFLFRIEREPLALHPGSPYKLSDLDLASRLSFFLWSSIPDEGLLDLAANGRLHDPAVLDRQVARMLHDSRSRALVENFVVDWLELGKLNAAVLDADLYRTSTRTSATRWARKRDYLFSIKSGEIEACSSFLPLTIRL